MKMLEHDEYDQMPADWQERQAQARYVNIKPIPTWKKIIILITIVPLGLLMLPFALFFGWRASKNV
jgi:hypothetical protein